MKRGRDLRVTPQQSFHAWSERTRNATEMADGAMGYDRE